MEVILARLPDRFRDPEWLIDRLSEEQFWRIASRRGYVQGLEHYSEFPTPVPQDTFYYYLLTDTSALLHYMRLYDESGKDHRYQPILIACDHLLPRQQTFQPPLPRFTGQNPAA